MFANITGWHLIAILAVILLLFGAAKLPALAKSVGQSARVFKGEMNAMKSDSAASGPVVDDVEGGSSVPALTRTDTSQHRSG